MVQNRIVIHKLQVKTRHCVSNTSLKFRGQTESYNRKLASKNFKLPKYTRPQVLLQSPVWINTHKFEYKTTRPDIRLMNTNLEIGIE